MCIFIWGPRQVFLCHRLLPILPFLQALNFLRSEFIICCEQFCAHTFIIEAGSQMKETSEKINSHKI